MKMNLKFFGTQPNFSIGSGTVAVNHDGNLTDSAYAVKEFSSLNYLPLEMSWADDSDQWKPDFTTH